MRYILLLLLVSFAATLPTTFTYRVYALSPGPDVYECWDEEKSGTLSNSCAKNLCEFNNFEKNWPENKGYYEDCSKYDSFIYNEYFKYGVAITLVLFISGALVWRKHKSS